MRKQYALAVLALSAITAQASAAVTLAEWTFETSVPTTAGPHAAEGGANAGSSVGFHSNGSAVYSNPVGNGSGESFSSNFWSTGDYYQFSTSTLGYESITFGWDQTRSGTGPATFDVQWSTDGTNFTTMLNDYNVDVITWQFATYNALSTYGPHAGPAGLDNQATVYFRLTSQVTASNTAGTNRVDNIIISGTLIPEPASFGLLAVGALAMLRRARKA